MTASIDARALYVTGKGGAGKSFITALLAREAARRGRRTAVIELVDERPSLEDVRAPRSAWIHPIVVDQKMALEHLLTRLLRLRFLSRRLLDSRTFSAVAAAAPGVKDLVYLSFIRDVAAGMAGRPYDLVIVNGLASGHSAALLRAPARIREVAPLGPVGGLIDEVDSFVRDPARFRVTVVTPPEELGVNETEELHKALAAARVAVTPTIVNGVYPPRLTTEQITWIRGHGASNDALLYVKRRVRQLELAERAASPGGPVTLVPFLFGASPVEARVRCGLFDTLAGAWT